MTAPNRHICLRFAQIKDVFLFATCEKLVVDLEGNIWYPEFYKGSTYFRKRGFQYRVAKSTLIRNSKPCNVILWFAPTAEISSPRITLGKVYAASSARWRSCAKTEIGQEPRTPWGLTSQRPRSRWLLPAGSSWYGYTARSRRCGCRNLRTRYVLPERNWSAVSREIG